VLVLALVAMGLGQVVLAFSTEIWVLSLALAFWGVATGLAGTLGQNALVARFPEQLDRQLGRWTMFSAAGDLAAPLLVAAVVGAGGGWRTACLLTAGLAFLNAFLLIGGSLAFQEEEEEEKEPLKIAMPKALKNKYLLLWLLAATGCTLLDEIFVVFGSLKLAESGTGSVEAALQFAACSLGSILGLGLLDRAGLSTGKVLGGASILTALLLIFWLFDPGGWLALPVILLLGAGIAPLYPLCMAQAYKTFPGRPGIVAAIGQLYTGLDLLAPLLIGFMADRYGLTVAIGLLLLQPLLVVGVLVTDSVRNNKP
jgi:MFS family permease